MNGVAPAHSLPGLVPALRHCLQAFLDAFEKHKSSVQMTVCMKKGAPGHLGK